MTYWLMKSEPTEYSIDDLARDGVSSWFGVRNYLARNYMRDQMQIGDRVFFYHSSCPVPGIVGIAEVVSGAHPDSTQFDIGGKYYDPKASQGKPIWQCVDIRFVEKFSEVLHIASLRNEPKLQGMVILQKGNRLSITPVTALEYETILTLSRRD